MNPPPPRPLRLGLLQYRPRRVCDLAAFAAALEERLQEGRAGADLLVLPEYAAVELAPALVAEGANQGAMREAAELAALTAIGPALLEVMRSAACRLGVWLLPGTLPLQRRDGAIVNRAPLIAPNGRIAFQDKRIMTRFEAERWGISPGDDPAVFDTPWGRLGISICYDLEFPKHARVQVEAGAWVILAPCCTDTLAGFNRVRVAAAARAMENQCYVAITPTVGEAPWSAALDCNRGFAAVFGPIDEGFPEDGLLARGALDQEGWVFATLDPARILWVREHGQVRNHRDWPKQPFAPAQPALFA